jgi:hypothetical protein
MYSMYVWFRPHMSSPFDKLAVPLFIHLILLTLRVCDIKIASRSIDCFVLVFHHQRTQVFCWIMRFWRGDLFFYTYLFCMQVPSGLESLTIQYLCFTEPLCAQARSAARSSCNTHHIQVDLESKPSRPIAKRFFPARPCQPRQWEDLGSFKTCGPGSGLYFVSCRMFISKGQNTFHRSEKRSFVS